MYATKPGWARWLGHFIRRRAVFSATIFAGIGTAILGGAVGFSRPDGNLHVYLLDMGHSNAIFMETPGGAHMLIDGGRFPSRLLTALGDRMPFTDRTIEVLAISQPDEADMAALAAVLNRYDIGVAMLNGQPNLSETFVEVQARLSRYKGVIVRSGYALDFDDGVRIEVLHPQEQPDLSASLNEHALVLRVSYGGVSFLLTADVSQAGQRTILETGGWPLARVMQVPQHGTINALDEDFLDAVQPQVLILQSDRANRRGDPDPDTLTLMGDMPLFRTDEGGTIHFWTDGSDLWVQQER
jgi:competence protein ComEC